METFVKGELQCGDVYPSLVQDWLYVETGGEFYYYAVFSSLEKGPRTSYLCVYDLSEIRAVMDIVKTCNNNPGLLSGAITPMAGSPIVGHSGGLYTQLQVCFIPVHIILNFDTLYTMDAFLYPKFCYVYSKLLQSKYHLYIYRDVCITKLTNILSFLANIPQ